MIVADRKPLDEIIRLIGSARRIAIVGCGECVTVCHSGGEKNVLMLERELRMHSVATGAPIEVSGIVSRRQCDPEFNEDAAGDWDVIVSLGCGAGAQTLAAQFPSIRVIPGLNTRFMGAHTSLMRWEERCAGCGNCSIHLFAGLCPIARCSKSLLNGPCGGSFEGHCEIDRSIECVWQKIVDRLTEDGRLDTLDEVCPPKDWRTSGAGGPRVYTSEDN